MKAYDWNEWEESVWNREKGLEEEEEENNKRIMEAKSSRHGRAKEEEWNDKKE